MMVRRPALPPAMVAAFVAKLVCWQLLPTALCQGLHGISEEAFVQGLEEEVAGDDAEPAALSLLQLHHAKIKRAMKTPVAEDASSKMTEGLASPAASSSSRSHDDDVIPEALIEEQLQEEVGLALFQSEARVHRAAAGGGLAAKATSMVVAADGSIVQAPEAASAFSQAGRVAIAVGADDSLEMLY
eukprot:TRINITY_DN14122_c0_g1_i1.p2 TRINITY_DN14122_c0_g1~~TRINITY_DN14122_c0_g1_i1.p2  ORF type:complete len:186 (-),score=66.77 TRINITY_DN14122_c0_g1_i1:83-640(-)